MSKAKIARANAFVLVPHANARPVHPGAAATVEVPTVAADFMSALWDARADASPAFMVFSICKSMMKPKVVVMSTRTASTLLPRLILPSASTAQVSASDFGRKVHEAG